ncbi:MAG: hypothetical protein ABEK59_08265 [Halobacteria archaeon]
MGVAIDTEVESADKIGKYEVTMRLNGSGYETIQSMSKMSGEKSSKVPSQMKQEMKDNISKEFKSVGNISVDVENISDGVIVTTTVKDAVPKNNSNITLRSTDNGSVLFKDNVNKTLGSSTDQGSLGGGGSSQFGQGPSMGPGTGMGDSETGPGPVTPDSDSGTDSGMKEGDSQKMPSKEGSDTGMENTSTSQESSLTLLQAETDQGMENDTMQPDDGQSQDGQMPQGPATGGQMPSGSSPFPGGMSSSGTMWMNVSFEYHLEMPGKILNSTSDNVSGSTATWEDSVSVNLTKELEKMKKSGAQPNKDRENAYDKTIMAVSKSGSQGQPGFGFTAAIAALAAIAGAGFLMRRD